MVYHLKSLAALLLVGAVCQSIGCASAPSPAPADNPPLQDVRAEADAFQPSLADHLAARPARRDSLRRQALEKADGWRDFEREVRESSDAQLRQWYHPDGPPLLSQGGYGVGNGLQDLREATAIDPTYVAGWAAMGKLSAEVGDQLSALQYLDHARAAADALTGDGQEVDENLLLDIRRNRAWVLRDLARWDEGLAEAQKGLADHPRDQELQLIKGLLLADSGRYQDAISLAVRMDPIKYPQHDFTYRGFKDQTSAYANNWIRAMALLADGKPNLALAKFGDLSTYTHRPQIPFGSRFWQDAGLVAELAGDSQAPLYYSMGMITHPYRFSFPSGANNVTPQVLGWPDAHMPVYTSYGPRFFVGGSPFTFVGMQINLLAEGLFPAQRDQAAGRAMHQLDLLEQRNLRPDICQALRGRIFYINEDFGPAQRELGHARTAFAALGQVDPITDLLLGLMNLRSKQFAEAETVLTEAVEADSTSAIAWRSLGVASVRLGHQERALEAMDRAVELDPWNVAGLYNRGLFRFQAGRLGPATSDMQRALALDSENREVQRLRGLILQAAAQTGVDSATVAMVAQGTPLGEAANPEVMLERYQAEIDEMFTVPDSLAVDTAEAERRIEILQNRYMRDRDPLTRAVLALALIDHRQLAEAQGLLAPGWGVDLSPEEELMLLYVDRELGERERAQQVVQEAIASGRGSGNPYAITLATETMRSFSVDPEGTDPVAPNTHGFFGWFRDASSSYRVSKDRGFAIQDLGLFRKYGSDPMFEDAVWGMTRTPIGGTGAGKQ
ncbi:tetratricopeptide repeat protein [bacterium]|nr:tetratricopeptide repeat protein [bacterium]PJA74929.1 MAG: hypothetical protein CO151_08290 [bacterium CG_4_9_14_3_um_filter_65_15]